MSSVPEILAPAGGIPQLEAAVRSGADAVYLGASSLNARCSAANFDDGQLRKAAEYCHIRGVKLYLTLNTLIFDSEFAEADRIISLACDTGVDGIIVQDIGLASYIAKTAPGMRLHASTQCSVQTLSGLRMLSRLGFCRAVLARELSLGELAGLAASSPIELEYFVHGALCMSVSGQCWLSAVIGQRSGNRGRCAQPCRLPFRDGSYMNCLSLKDSSLIPSIGELADMGIASLKIEGRLKRPEYCAAVTDACVRARDKKEGVSRGDMETLAAVFSRSGFTDAYFSGVENSRCGRRDMFGIRTKDDVTASDGSVFAKIHTLYKNERSSVPVSFVLSQNENGFVLAVSDGDGNTAQAAAAFPPDNGGGDGGAAVSAPALSKLKKTGGTPYCVKTLSVDNGVTRYLPPSAAGNMRRDALEKLSEIRASGKPVPKSGCCNAMLSAPEPHTRLYGQRLDMVFRSAGQIPESFPEAGKLLYGRAFLPLEMPAADFERAAERLRKSGMEPALECARGMFGRDERIKSLLCEKKALGVNICMAHNLGAVQLALEAGMECVGGFGLNITNTLSLCVLEELRLTCAELSFELTAAQIRALGGTLARGAVIYGRLPLMLTRCCPASLESGCRGFSAAGADRAGTKLRGPEKTGRRYCFITDRLGKEFPVLCREGCSEVYNTVPLCVSDKLHEFSSVERLSARFSTESAEDVRDIIEYIMREANITRGSGVTRGLYFRGVE